MSGRAWIVFGVMCLAACVAGFMAVMRVVDVDDRELAGSVVSIMGPSQVAGSAVHIGNGALFTALHVLSEEKEYTVRLDDDREVTATVLWRNESSDIALLHAYDLDSVAVASLSCSVPEIEAPITLRGNPMNMGLVSLKASVAANPRQVNGYETLHPLTLQGAVLFGMSGGGAFDRHGNLIGIILSFPDFRMRAMTPLGPIMTSSHPGLSYIAPGSVLCGLLARA